MARYALTEAGSSTASGLQLEANIASVGAKSISKAGECNGIAALWQCMLVDFACVLWTQTRTTL